MPNALALLIAVLLAFGALGVFGAMRSVSVERVVVLGKLANVQQEALHEALRSELHAGLLFLDLGRLRDRLEDLPWVYRAQVRRRFPETLEVQVTEQRPIARWGEYAFLNQEARVIAVSDGERWQDLPALSGAEGREANLVDYFLELQEKLRAAGLALVALREDDFGQLFATLDNGTELSFGASDFRSRVERFLMLWDRELRHTRDRGVARVDLRYYAGAAVEFAENPQLIKMTAAQPGGAGE